MSAVAAASSVEHSTWLMLASNMGCLSLVGRGALILIFVSLMIVLSSKWQARDSDDIIGPESFDLHNGARFRLRYNIIALFRQQFSIFSNLMIVLQTEGRLSGPVSTV